MSGRWEYEACARAKKQNDGKCTEEPAFRMQERVKAKCACCWNHHRQKNRQDPAATENDKRCNSDQQDEEQLQIHRQNRNGDGYLLAEIETWAHTVRPIRGLIAIGVAEQGDRR